MRRVEMNFLPDVQVLCDVCHGRRFNAETLSILFKGKSIGEVLDLSVEDAVEIFAAHRTVHRATQLLADVGLGYLSLGQPSPTLSGGESQRVKLVTELSKVRADAPGHALYVLDDADSGIAHGGRGESATRIAKARRCWQYRGRHRTQPGYHGGRGLDH